MKPKEENSLVTDIGEFGPDEFSLMISSDTVKNYLKAKGLDHTIEQHTGSIDTVEHAAQQKGSILYKATYDSNGKGSGSDWT